MGKRKTPLENVKIGSKSKLKETKGNFHNLICAQYINVVILLTEKDSRHILFCSELKYNRIES